MESLDDLLPFEPTRETIDFMNAIGPSLDIPYRYHKANYRIRSHNNQLFTARRQRGLTQAALAKWAGTTRKTIGYIEADKRIPSVYLALAIAEVLEMKVEDIFKLEPLLPLPPSKY